MPNQTTSNPIPSDACTDLERKGHDKGAQHGGEPPHCGEEADHRPPLPRRDHGPALGPRRAHACVALRCVVLCCFGWTRGCGWWPQPQATSTLLLLLLPLALLLRALRLRYGRQLGGLREPDRTEGRPCLAAVGQPAACWEGVECQACDFIEFIGWLVACMWGTWGACLLLLFVLCLKRCFPGAIARTSEGRDTHAR
jgi:hypothetical protein